jgi:multicomponent Na+:H+ antiporter subunit F
MTTVASSVLLPAMLLLLLTLAVGLVRALRGPSLQDRMLSILLIGSGGVALLLLMSGYLNMPALIDVSLVLALLAVLAAAALTRIEVDHD